MEKVTLSFFAPLGNVDESILNLKLPQGFEFAWMPSEEGYSFIANLEKFPRENIFQWRHVYTVLSYNGLFFIKKSFNFDLPKNEKGEVLYSHELYDFVFKLVKENVETPLQLLRLYKEGNIHLACWYVYPQSDSSPRVILAGGGVSSPQDQNLLHFENSEIEDVQRFLETTKVPFNYDYLTLAHSNYELSYKVHDDSLSFLALMIALEVLFKPREEKTKAISGNASILLSTSAEDKEKIEREIRNLYSKRSELVHEGKIILCYVGEDDDVKILRRYVRDSLKAIIPMNLSKDELINSLKAKCPFLAAETQRS